MRGLDTGFFFRLVVGAERARALFEGLVRREQDAAVSTVTLFEMIRHGWRGSLSEEVVERMVADVGEAFTIAGTDDLAVLRRAAGLAHGIRLAMADALIVASLEHAGCSVFYTTDGDFDRYDGPLQVEML